MSIRTSINLSPPVFQSKKRNILFVIDSSRSIGTDNYAKLLDFVVQVTQVFNVSVNEVNFSAITYSDSITPLFDFSVATHQEIKQATLNAALQPCGTLIAEALRRAGDLLMSHSQGFRSDSKNIAIVITHGASADPRETCEEAKRLQDLGIFLIAIGVARANLDELNMIATSPEDVYYVDKFEALVDIKTKIWKHTEDIETALRPKQQRVP